MWMSDWKGHEDSPEIASFEKHLMRIGKLLGITLPLNKYFIKEEDSMLTLIFRAHHAHHRTAIRVRIVMSNSTAVNLDIDGRRVVVNGEVGREVVLITQEFMKSKDLIKQVIESRDNTVYED